MASQLVTSMPTASVDDIEDIAIAAGHQEPGARLSQRAGNVVGIGRRVRGRGKPLSSGFDGIPGAAKIWIHTWGCAHNTSDGEFMAGQLAEYGFQLLTSDQKENADCWVLNSCTVKGPSEAHFLNEVEKARALGIKVVVAGCVPQAQQNHRQLKDVSILGVMQIDRVVEIVEEALKGHTVRFMTEKRDSSRKKLGGASLSLPKIRKNPLIDIIPINTGCLNQCTYCKTKHARGDLGSYSVEDLCLRLQEVGDEPGVREVWLSSEDTGAYGRDIGTSLPKLLKSMLEVLPKHLMLRIGMTNPPYILEHLEELSEILLHPQVFKFLHIPVQAGSDSVLYDMKRKYTVADFKRVVDTLVSRVPGMTIATDIICGYPTETAEDFEETIALCSEYKFPVLNISQFYPRPGTPAARLPLLPSEEVKRRSRQLTELFYSYDPYKGREGEVVWVLVTEKHAKRNQWVGHTISYEQIVIGKDVVPQSLMGCQFHAKIVKTTKFSMEAIPISETIRKPDSEIVSGLKSEQSSSTAVDAFWHWVFPLLYLLISVIAGTVLART